MTTLFSSIVRILLSAITISMFPPRDYRKYVPSSAGQLMRNNWINTGETLKKAMDKVGDEIGQIK